MTAAIEAVQLTEALNTPPVCLAPWLENPYRLVSLLDMLQVYAKRYIDLGISYEHYTGSLLAMATSPKAVPTDEQFLDLMAGFEYLRPASKGWFQL
jgi:hypothetical protein